jgi:hypothetical protein
MLFECSAAVSESILVLEAATAFSTLQAMGMGWEGAVTFSLVLLSDLSPMVERTWLTDGPWNLSLNWSVMVL